MNQTSPGGSGRKHVPGTSYPRCPALAKLPTKAKELFLAIGSTVIGPNTYRWPWPASTEERGWREARHRLNYFLEHAAGASWVPFNGSESSEGPMGINGESALAAVERCTNAIDTCIEEALKRYKGSPLTSPVEAVAELFGLRADTLVDPKNGLTDEQAHDFSKKHFFVRTFTAGGKETEFAKRDTKDLIIDFRDFGTGLAPTEFADTILSLNRGNKRHKPYLTGKHGQGAANTYAFSDMTVIASRLPGSSEVGFTVVQKFTRDADGRPYRTPVYRYLIIDGEIPSFTISEEIDFEPGTLCRHIGYEAGEMLQSFGEKSVYGVLQRSLAKPLFPIRIEHQQMYATKIEGKEVGPGWGTARLIRGTVNVLRRAEKETKDRADTKNADKPHDNATIRHVEHEFFDLGLHDFGGPTGVGDLGRVWFHWWAAEQPYIKEHHKECEKPKTDSCACPKKLKNAKDVVRNWIDPATPIVFTLDGQTHAEESVTLITQRAGLWAIGKLMVVHVDLDGLTAEARDLLLTSGRERLKEGPVKDKIIGELVRRLANDKRLQELQNEIAARPKTSQEEEETFADVIEEHLKKSGVNFEAVAKRVWALTTQDEEVDVPGGEGGGGKGKQELPPIPSKDPPDMIRWMVKKPEYTMYPGQTYSWTFETNAPPSYWDPDDPSAKIRVYGDRFVHFTGAPSTMRGGRVRCSFECSQNAKVGTRQAVEVRMVVAAGTSFMSKLDIVVTAKPVASTKSGGPSTNPGSDSGTKLDGPGKGPGKGGTGPNGLHKETRPITKHRWVTAQRFLLIPKPINRRDHEGLWQAIGWPEHVGYAGFVTLKEQGKIAIYYNEELPALLEAKRLWDKRNMGEVFLEKYKVRLAMHVVFAYNLDVLIDETEVPEEVRKRVREDRIATAQDLVHAVSSEMEIEYKIAKEG